MSEQYFEMIDNGIVIGDDQSNVNLGRANCDGKF